MNSILNLYNFIFLFKFLISSDSNYDTTESQVRTIYEMMKETNIVLVNIFPILHVIPNVCVKLSQPFSIPPIIVDCGFCLTLKSLSLSRMSLKELPDYIYKCENLSYLDLSDNKLDNSCFNILYCLPNLNILNLKKNIIQLLPERIFKNIKSLDLSNNFFEPLPYDIYEANIQILKINGIFPIKNGFINPHNKEIINNILRICMNIVSLEKLEFSQNMLHAINFYIEKSNIKTLNFKNNKLISIPESIKNLKKLEILDLSNNQFINVPEVLLSMITLNELNISDNPIIKYSLK